MKYSYFQYLSTSAKKAKIVTKYGVSMTQDYLEPIGKNLSTVCLTDNIDDPAIRKNMKGVHTYDTHIEYLFHINFLLKL